MTTQQTSAGPASPGPAPHARATARRDPTSELTVAELAWVYRHLTDQVGHWPHPGDPPERWFRDVLLRQIRLAVGLTR